MKVAMFDCPAGVESLQGLAGGTRSPTELSASHRPHLRRPIGEHCCKTPLSVVFRAPSHS